MSRFASLLVVLVIAGPASAQVKCTEGLTPIDRQADARMTPMDFVKDVTTKELEFNKAFTNFGYTLEIQLQTVDEDKVDGEYHEVTRVDFDANGSRHINMVGTPTNTLQRLPLPHRDVDQMRDAFIITREVLAGQDVVYSGRERVQDFNAAVFDILPRNDQPGASSFTGRVWVRQREAAIIRSCGRFAGGPFGAMRYLVDRTKVADLYWFPAQVRADEKVRVKDDDVHLRVSVKYSDYKAR